MLDVDGPNGCGRVFINHDCGSILAIPLQGDARKAVPLDEDFVLAVFDADKILGSIEDQQG